MVKPKPCIICRKLSILRKGYAGVASSRRSRETLKKFYQLLGRDPADPDRGNDKPKRKPTCFDVDNDNEEEEEGGVFENLDKAGMLSCEECSGIMESYCELFLQMKTIELQLYWKLETLERMLCGKEDMDYGKQLEIRGGGGSRGTGSKNKKVDLLLDFRTDLVKKCRRKLRAALPRVNLVNYQPRAEGAASVGHLLAMEGQYEAPTLIKTEPDEPPSFEEPLGEDLLEKLPHEHGIIVGESWSWNEDADHGLESNQEVETNATRGDPDWTIELEFTEADDDVQLTGSGNNVGEESVQVIENLENGKFKCRRCEREFTGHNDCRRHYQEVHLRVKSFQCPTCNQCFARNYHLSRHLQNVHGEARGTVHRTRLVKNQLPRETGLAVEEAEENRNENDFGDGPGHLGDPEYVDPDIEKQIGMEIEGEGRHDRIEREPEVDGMPIADSEDALGKTEEPDLEQISQNPENGKFKCLTCQKEFTVRKDCRRHYQQVHLRIKSFQCITCSQSFARKYHLARHHQQVHSQKLASEAKTYKHPCSICRKRFSRMDQLRRHLRKVHSATIVDEGRPPSTSPINYGVTGKAHTSFFTVKCPICYKRFRSTSQLGRHRKEVKCIPGRFLQTTFRKHVCPLCDMGFSRPYHLNRHMKNIHFLAALPDPAPAGTDTETATDTDLIVTPSGSTKGPRSNNSAFNSDTGRYKCGRCEREFKTTWHLQDHQRISHLNHTIQCALCPKRFRHRKSYWTHRQVTHLGVRHQCDRCGKRFIVKTSLLRHQKVGNCSSTEETPLPPAPVACDICQKSFRQLGDLKVHVKYVHEKVRDHLCPQCGKGFCTGPGLKRHIMGVHDRLREHLCDLCGRGFSDNSHLKRHRRVVHPVETGAVGIIGSHSNSKKRRRHRQKAHPGEIEEAIIAEVQVKDEAGSSVEDIVSLLQLD